MFGSSHFSFLVTLGDEVTKIQKYYVIFVYILQGKMGKMETQLKWPKFQKPKDDNMGWTKHFILFSFISAFLPALKKIPCQNFKSTMTSNLNDINRCMNNQREILHENCKQINVPYNSQSKLKHRHWINRVSRSNKLCLLVFFSFLIFFFWHFFDNYGDNFRDNLMVTFLDRF